MSYYVLYFFLAVLCIINPYVKKTQQYSMVYLGAFAILLFQALRWKTGTDWIPYYEKFLNSNNPAWEKYITFEYGFRYLNSIIRKITDSYTIFLFVECGLNLLFSIIFIKKMNVSNPCLALLYLFVIVIFPIRYTLAMSMILCSYYYILEKKFIPFTILVIGAFLIHRTTIIFFPLYFICQYKIPFKLLFSVYIIATILGILVEYTFGNLLQMASLMYGYADETVQDKMEAYMSGDLAQEHQKSIFRLFLSFLNSTFFILFFYYFKNNRFHDDRKYEVLFTLYVLGISFNRIFIQTIPDIARLTSLFTGGYIVMLIMIISSMRKWIRPLATMLVLLYLFMTYYSSIHGVYEDLFIPYYTVFENPNRPMY